MSGSLTAVVTEAPSTAEPSTEPDVSAGPVISREVNMTDVSPPVCELACVAGQCVAGEEGAAQRCACPLGVGGDLCETGGWERERERERGVGR